MNPRARRLRRQRRKDRASEHQLEVDRKLERLRLAARLSAQAARKQQAEAARRATPSGGAMLTAMLSGKPLPP